MGAIVEAASKGNGLTDRQNRLVEDLSIALDDQDGLLTDRELAEIAGYSSPADFASAVRSETVQAELKARRAAKIRGTLAQKALKTMESLLGDKNPGSVRFGAAKWLLEQAGHTDAQAEAKDKPLHEMSEAELLAFMARAEKVVQGGGSAPVITVTP